MKGILDAISLILIFIGISLIWFGHHYFGPLAFWLGAAIAGCGLALLARTAHRQRKVDRALADYSGPGDYGDTHYHQGASHSGHDHNGDD